MALAGFVVLPAYKNTLNAPSAATTGLVSPYNKAVPATPAVTPLKTCGRGGGWIE